MGPHDRPTSEWAELAALQWDDYSLITNAISELSLTDSPSVGFLQPWEFVAYHVFVIAFGIGAWQSARGNGALRMIGTLQVLSGAAFPFWLAFGEASVAAHVVLSTVAILTWLGSLGFGAASFGKRFRLYSLITLAAVLVFNALAFMYVPRLPPAKRWASSGCSNASPSAPTSCGSGCWR